jgi:hypothetical protein
MELIGQTGREGGERKGRAGNQEEPGGQYVSISSIHHAVVNCGTPQGLMANTSMTAEQEIEEI